MNGNNNSPLGNDSNGQPNGMMPYGMSYSCKYPNITPTSVAFANFNLRP